MAIDARWDGKALDLGGRDRYKRLKIGNITADSTSGDISVDFYASVDGSTFANLGAIETMTTGSRLGPTGTFRLGPTGANTLGGSSQASLRYLYTNGGGSARAKLLTHSIRHNTAGESPIVNTFSTSYRMWDVR